jgi:gas vesicle protein
MSVKKEDILEALGFETKTSWLPIALAGFGVGCAVGAAVAMLLTPKSGRELRSDIMTKGRDLIGRGKEMMGQQPEMPKTTY